MTDQATRIVAAGWYEDPTDPAQVRWWNGIAWTEHRRPKPATTPASAPAPVATASNPSQLTAPVPTHATTATGPSWFLAFSALLFAATNLVAIIIEAYYGQNPLLYAVTVIAYGATVWAAFLDVKTLRRWGHTAPSALWVLAGPLVYLVIRAIKLAGWRQVITHVLVVLALLGTAAFVLFADAAQPLRLGAQIQSEIRTELVSTGVATAVACPALAEASRTAMHTCEVTMADGSQRTLWVNVDPATGEYDYSLSLSR